MSASALWGISAITFMVRMEMTPFTVDQAADTFAFEGATAFIGIDTVLDFP